MLTRQEITPFILPRRLIQRLDHNPPGTSNSGLKDLNQEAFSYKSYSDLRYQFDVDGNQDMYHAPGSARRCKRVSPPKKGKDYFNQISQRAMPGVNLENVNDPNQWWEEADGETLTVSYIWTDGVSGTRNIGLNQCAHDLLVETAKDQNCNSY